MKRGREGGRGWEKGREIRGADLSRCGKEKNLRLSYSDSYRGSSTISRDLRDESDFSFTHVRTQLYGHASPITHHPQTLLQTTSTTLKTKNQPQHSVKYSIQRYSHDSRSAARGTL
jgi:hypothetical protein